MPVHPSLTEAIPFPLSPNNSKLPTFKTQGTFLPSTILSGVKKPSPSKTQQPLQNRADLRQHSIILANSSFRHYSFEYDSPLPFVTADFEIVAGVTIFPHDVVFHTIQCICCATFLKKMYYRKM
ncbi:hypothetical protein TNCV_1248871 [Trichonephila clavipes]|nr:hypothetical protein TNCV_1248871 [Trichonephila clavipes]